MTDEPRDPGPASGEPFGPYVLDGVLGRGGMGVVYRARDTAKGRTVAVKLLARELADDDAFRARFQRESRIAARLSDPHVIPIHDFGEIDGRLFLDMRLVEGRDLADRIARDGPLDAATAVGVVAQAAGALDAAHDAGLVHRDVKPANILLSGSGRPGQLPFAYLVDFGIARAVSGAATSQLTTTGTVGTVAYMAPERILGDPGDGRADVYALGCVLYETLVGRRPFDGEAAAVLYAQVNVAPDLGPLTEVLPPASARAMADVVGRALAKDPAARFATAGELADAAAAALDTAAAPHAATAPARTPPDDDATVRVAAPPDTPALPPLPPADPTVRSRCGRRTALIVAAVVVIAGVVAAVLAGLGSGGDTAASDGPRSPAAQTGGPTTRPASSSPVVSSPAPAPFTSPALWQLARPYFEPDRCVANPPAADAPLAVRLPDLELVRCASGGWSAVFFRKSSAAGLRAERLLYHGEGVASTRRAETGFPGDSTVTFAESFLHTPYGGDTPPRVYWEDAGARCAAELQPLSGQDRAATVAFWHDGA